VTGVLVFKFGGRPGLFHTLMFPYLWSCISILHIEENV
jgi:hypothetical protein